MSTIIPTLFEESGLDNSLNLINTTNNETFYKSNAGIDVRNIILSSDKTLAVTLSFIDDKITIFDLTNLTKQQTITSIRKPLDAVISDDNDFLYVVCNNDLSIYKVPLNNPSGTITSINLSFYPKRIITNSDNSILYCAGNTNVVQAINTTTFTITSTISLGGNKNHFDLANFMISSDNSLLIYGSKEKGLLEIVNLQNNTTNTINLTTYSSTIKIVDFTISADVSIIYVLTLDGKNSIIFKISTTGNILTVVNQLSYINTRLKGLVISLSDTSLYLINSKNKLIQIINLSTFSKGSDISLSKTPYFLLLDSTNNLGYAIDKHSGYICTINLSTNVVSSVNEGAKSILSSNFGDISYNYPNTINEVQNQYNVRGPLVISDNRTNIPVNLALNRKQNDYIVINGKVIDSTGAVLIPDSIELSTFDGTSIGSYETLENGTFSFSLSKTAEDYVMTFSNTTTGTDAMEIIDVSSPSIEDMSVVLIANYYSQFGEINGHVYDSNNNPISNAIVQFFIDGTGSSKIFQGEVITGIDGAYEKLALPFGNYTVIITRNGYLSSTSEVTISSTNKIVTSDITLTSDATANKTIGGTVSLSSGIKTSGIVLRLFYYNNGLKIVQDIQTSNTTGQFTFTNIPSKTYYVEGQYWF